MPLTVNLEATHAGSYPSSRTVASVIGPMQTSFDEVSQ